MEYENVIREMEGPSQVPNTLLVSRKRDVKIISRRLS